MYRFSRITTVFLVGLVLLACTSCTSESTTSVDKPEAVKPKADVSVTVASVAEFEESVKSHVGKVVVVDLWAMW